MPDDTNDIVSWETYMTGPRWALRDGTIRKGLLDLASEVSGAGLEGWQLDLVYEQRVTSLATATVFFKVTGKRWCVHEFKQAVEDAAARNNLPCPV